MRSLIHSNSHGMYQTLKLIRSCVHRITQQNEIYLSRLHSSALLGNSLYVASPKRSTGSILYCKDSERRLHSRGFHSSRIHYAQAQGAAKEDLYGLLGVSQSASNAELKKAYYKLAKELHPDSGNGDREKFAKVGHAYEVLSDEKKRRVYDQYGHDGVDAVNQGMDPDQAAAGMDGMGGMHGFDAEDLFKHFGDVFGMDMRGASARRGEEELFGRSRGSDIKVRMTLSFKNAVQGVEKQVSYKAEVECNPCSGTGKTEKTKVEECGACGGTGLKTVARGFMMMQSTCGTCGGAGRAVKNPCSSCKGTGTKRGTKETIVRVPPGVDTGMNLVMTGAGHAGRRKGPAGDLILVVTVEADDYFVREGPHVHVMAPISFPVATLGGEVRIRSLGYGTDAEYLTVKVPKGTQPDTTETIPGAGMPVARGSSLFSRSDGRGNMIVHFKLVVPEYLDSKSEELIRELANQDTMASDHKTNEDWHERSNPSRRSLWKKVRDYVEMKLMSGNQ